MKKLSDMLTSIVSGIDLEVDDSEIIKDLTKKFIDTQTAWHDNYEKMRIDVKFFNGIQYDEQWARASRARGRKVQIQLNMLPQNVQVIENQIRQMDIAVVVHSTDEKGSEETAEIFEGIFRHIENCSNAKQAYISAYGKNGALVPGLGFVKWNKRYVSNTSMEQELYIEEIKDPFRILVDYYAKKSDFSDAEFWFEFDLYSKDDFEKKFPHAQLSSFQSWDGCRLKGWVYESSVQVVKYWYKDSTEKLLITLEDGQTGFSDELGYDNFDPTENSPQRPTTPQEQYLHMEMSKDEKGNLPKDYQVPLSTPLQVKDSRLSNDVKIKWILTNGVEILEQGEWDDSEFPFVGFVGTDTYYDGERQIYGLIRNTHDSQKMINYMASNFIQKVGATNKTPWIASVEAIPENLRKDWNSSNVDEKAVLYYQEYVNGRQITPPFRGDNVEPAVQALLQGSQLFGESLKKTMGIPDAMLGTLPNQAIQQSGVAVNNLTEQGAQANHHFTDNMVLSMKRIAELGIRLIPKIYDTERAIRIIGADGEQELIRINEIFNHKGKQVHYDLTAGEYGVTIDTGPSFSTRKAQTSEQLIKFLSIEPQLAPVVADIFAKNSDWDVNGALADRIKLWQSSVMPWMAQADNQDPIPPQAMAQMTQMQNQHGQLLQLLQKVELENQHLKQEKQAKVIDNAAKERLEIIRNAGNLQIERLKLQSTMIESKDDMVKFSTQTQLEQIRHHQKLVMDHLKTHDKKYGRNEPDDYDSMSKMIE